MKIWFYPLKSCHKTTFTSPFEFKILSIFTSYYWQDFKIFILFQRWSKSYGNFWYGCYFKLARRQALHDGISALPSWLHCVWISCHTFLRLPRNVLHSERSWWKVPKPETLHWQNQIDLLARLGWVVDQRVNQRPLQRSTKSKFPFLINWRFKVSYHPYQALYLQIYYFIFLNILYLHFLHEY